MLGAVVMGEDPPKLFEIGQHLNVSSLWTGWLTDQGFVYNTLFIIPSIVD